MNVWNKVAIGLIIPSLLGAVYLSAMAMGAHHSYRGKIPSPGGPMTAVRLERKIAELHAQANLLLNGQSDAAYQASPNDPKVAGIRRTEARLATLLADRKRVWYGCQYQGGTRVNVPRSAAAEAAGAAKSGLTVNMIVYVFEDNKPDQHGGYVGEYLVTAVDDQGNIDLQGRLEIALERVNRDRNVTWTLCEQMPADRHDAIDKSRLGELFQGMTEAEIEKFANDGVEKDGTIYERPLIDYALAFQLLDTQIAHLKDQMASASIDIGSLTKARDHAIAQNDERDRDNRMLLLPELERSKAERDLVHRRLDSLTAAADAARAQIQSLVDENRRLGAEYAASQRDLVARIEAAVSAGMKALDANEGATPN